MRWPIATRIFGVYLALAVAVLAVSVWQWTEHQRFQKTAIEGLIHRGRDITSTLGVVVRSQRRYGGVVSKDRIEAAMQDLIRPGELESVAMLGATGEQIASAGKPVELTPEMLRARGLYWREHSLILMNLMDLGAVGSAGPDDHSRPPSTIVVPDPRAYRSGQIRRQGERPAADPATAKNGDATAPATSPRSPFGRPSWMSRDEYEAVIQKQGVHSLLIALSTDEMRRAVQNDFVLRVLVTGAILAATIISVLAWRNVRKNALLQIRLVKAGEMNAHLTEMNFAAAGLAHETRNPLNLIRGLAHMIAMEREATPKQKQNADSIIEEADRVTVQLNEFINYSKPREAHAAPVDVPRLVADVVRTLQPDIEEKQIQLRRSEVPLTIEADEPLFRQALFNLLLNAVQAVGPGGRIEVDWSAGPGREATLEVRDEGPGVPATERKAIFKPYVTMRPKGVGLGLAIVHQIILAHGWEIACLENQPQGAVFRLTRLRISGSSPG